MKAKKFQSMPRIASCKVMAFVLFVVGLITGICITEIPDELRQIMHYDSKTWESKAITKTNAPIIHKTGDFELCFTPPKGCTNVIAREIDKAQTSIFMQAYGLTSRRIISSLLSAKKRGVKVRVILDRSNFTEKRTVVIDLMNAGIEVSKDRISGIAHNKVIVLDGATTITGSFNFTEAANNRNAENVVIIKDKAIATLYLENWKKRREYSE